MTIDLETQSNDGTPRKGELSLPSGLELWGLAGILALFLILGILLIVEGVPFGHEEALYSVRARDFFNGEPAASWWRPYRAPGLPVVLTVAWLGGGTEPYLRLVVLLSGAALVVVTWLLARMFVGSRPALIAALGTALTPFVVVAATQVWPDIPGAAVGAAALYMYARELPRVRFRWHIAVAVVLLTAFATVIRFGAPIPITVGLVGLTLWRWPSTRRQKAFVGVTALGVACAVALLLATPLLGNSATPLDGIASRSGSNPLFGGFSDYWELREKFMEGAVFVGAVGLLAGVAGSVLDRRYRQLFLWPFAIGLATFVTLATFVHGEPRYLAPVIPWFWISAAGGFAYLGKRYPKVVGTSGAATALVLVFLMPGMSDDGIRANDGFQTLKNAARSLQGQEECGVLTSYAPQVEWYSECETAIISTREVNVDSPDLPPGPRYLFMVDRGKRQPDAQLFEEYVAYTTGEPTLFRPYRNVDIWRVKDF